MSNLDDFINGYITAALWSSTDESTPEGGEPLDKNYGPEDIAPSSLEAIKRDCTKFFETYPKALEAYAERVKYNPAEGTPYDYAGHDFWLTANGHGCGFWDREGIPEILGEKLSEASKPFASDLYVGDDGKIYVTPER